MKASVKLKLPLLMKDNRFEQIMEKLSLQRKGKEIFKENDVKYINWIRGWSFLTQQ